MWERVRLHWQSGAVLGSAADNSTDMGTGTNSNASELMGKSVRMRAKVRVYERV